MGSRFTYAELLPKNMKDIFIAICFMPITLRVLRTMAEHNIPLPFLGSINEDSQTQQMTSTPFIAKNTGNQLVHKTGLQKHVIYYPEPEDRYHIEGGVQFGVAVQRREGILIKERTFGGPIIGGFGDGFINELPDGTFVSHLSNDFRSIVLPRVANGAVQGRFSKIFAVGPVTSHNPGRWKMSSTGYYRPQDFYTDMPVHGMPDFADCFYQPHYVGQTLINEVFKTYTHHPRLFDLPRDMNHMQRRAIGRNNNIMLAMPVRRYSSKTKEYEVDTSYHLWGNFGTNCRDYITSQIANDALGALQETIYHNPEPSLSVPF